MAPTVLSDDQLWIFEELRKIFPNHKKSVIKKTVLRISEVEGTEESCLHRCIEELVNICPVEVFKKKSIKQKSQTVLSSIQKDVLNELTQIFSTHDIEVIGTSVCHPSNLFEPLTQQSLLQRCIDDILDARTAHEAASGTYFKASNGLRNSTDDDVSITQVEEPADVSITEVEEPADVSITQEEEAMNMQITPEEEQEVIIASSEDARNNTDWSYLSDDEEELPAVGQLNGLKSTSFSPQQAQSTVSVPAGKQQPPQCSGKATPDKITNSTRENEITGNQSKTGRVKTPVGVVKSRLATGLSTATAHISLTEKDDESLSVSPSITFQNKNDVKDKVTNLSEKQPCEHSSTALTNTSFSLSRADMFSTSTIESSDSEGSLSNGSFDSQPEDDNLPQITFQKKHLIRDSVFSSPESMSPKVKLDKNSNASERNPGKVNLNNDKDTSLKACNESELNVHLVTKGTSLNIPSGIAKDLQSTFQLSPPKLIVNFNADRTPACKLKTAQVLFDERKKSGEREADRKMHHEQNMSGTYTPWVPPVQSQPPKTVWSPPRAVGNQQTVTIKSTHKITYNNLVQGNIGQNTLQNNVENGEAKPHYSMSAPNLTVQMPLDQPRVEFRERYGSPSLTRTGSMPGSRSTLSVNSTTGIETPNLGSGNNSHAPPRIPAAFPVQRPPLSIPRPFPSIHRAPPSIHRPFPSIPRPFPVLRPPTLICQGATGSSKDTFNVNRPSFVAVPGSMSTSVPKITATNPQASHTPQNPETVLDPLPIIIPDDVGLDVRQPIFGIPHLEDTPEEVLVVGTEEVVNDVAEDPFLQVKNDVLNLFPEVEPGYLDNLCQKFDGPMAVNNICFVLLENNYPKKECKTVEKEKKSLPYVPTVDYYKDYHSVVIPDEMIIKYQAQAFQTLSQEFSWLSANDIKAVMKKVRYLYAPSYRALQSVWKQAVEVAKKKSTGEQCYNSFRGLTYQAKLSAEEGGGMECRISIKLLKNRRPFVKMHFDVIPELKREIDFVKYKLKAVELEADHRVAVALNEQEYEDQGQCIECGCCFGEYPFEQMVQCYEGHLFCENCLRQYAKESVFGQGKVDLKCMTELCDSSFPKSQLLKALPSEILEKYEDRVTEENLNLADLGDLVKCPHCDFRAFMDPDDKVFRCQSDVCKKQTCRYCQVEWEEHFGKKCSEVEKKDETKIRLQYEEKMTKAKVRVCHRCKAQFMKLDGCNKMTCRCGAKMCYICRQPNIDYNHFCRHPRDPGKECTQCRACNLWTNPEEDENRAVAEMQKEAEEERKKQGYTDIKVIGVPDQPPAKKVKR